MSTKLIVGCISGAGALGGVVGGSYYLLNKEPEKSQETNSTPREEDTVTKNTKPLRELMGEGFEALNTTAGQEKDNWKKLVAKYNAEGTSVAKIVVEGQITKDASDDDAENIKKLQAACTKLLAKTDIVDGDKEIATNWCNKNSTLITQ